MLWSIKINLFHCRETEVTTTLITLTTGKCWGQINHAYLCTFFARAAFVKLVGKEMMRIWCARVIWKWRTFDARESFSRNTWEDMTHIRHASKFCPIFTILPHIQNFALFSQFCPIFTKWNATQAQKILYIFPRKISRKNSTCNLQKRRRHQMCAVSSHFPPGKLKMTCAHLISHQKLSPQISASFSHDSRVKMRMDFPDA